MCYKSEIKFKCDYFGKYIVDGSKNHYDNNDNLLWNIDAAQSIVNTSNREGTGLAET